MTATTTTPQRFRLAEYRKAAVAGWVSALTGVGGAVGLVVYPWAADGHVPAASGRWALVTLLVAAINGVLSAYGVAAIPNAQRKDQP